MPILEKIYDNTMIRPGYKSIDNNSVICESIKGKVAVGQLFDDAVKYEEYRK